MRYRALLVKTPDDVVEAGREQKWGQRVSLLDSSSTRYYCVWAGDIDICGRAESPLGPGCQARLEGCHGNIAFVPSDRVEGISEIDFEDC